MGSNKFSPPLFVWFLLGQKTEHANGGDHTNNVGEYDIFGTIESLDYLFLWSFIVGSSKYFLQIEDDVVANPGFGNFIKKKINDRTKINKNWLALEFSSLGFIGKLFPEKTLRDLIRDRHPALVIIERYD